MNESQKQSAESGSIAVQAGGDVLVGTVLSYPDVRQIALDVYKANFYELSGEAKAIALARATEISERYLERLQTEYPDGLQQARDPALQSALFTAQKEHARVGEDELAELLVDLLVDRTKSTQRDLLRIVLDESLNTAPKLTNSQISALSAIFLMSSAAHGGLVSLDKLGAHFDRYIEPLIGQFSPSLADFQHLEFAGCGSFTPLATSLGDIVVGMYPGLFCEGFDASEFESRGIDRIRAAQFLMPSLHAKDKWQVSALTNDDLKNRLATHGVDELTGLRITELFALGRMNGQGARDVCVKLRPYLGELFEWWQGRASQFRLTSVGTAIGHANIQRYAGKFADLSIWIS